MYNGYSKERIRTAAILKREYITTNNNKPCAQHLFLMLNVSTRSQLIEFELIKPTGYLIDPVEGMSSKFSLSALKRFGSVAVITLASHARGPGFDPQPNLSLIHI